MVECSPAIPAWCSARAARVRFPADASLLNLNFSKLIGYKFAKAREKERKKERKREREREREYRRLNLICAIDVGKKGEKYGEDHSMLTQWEKEEEEKWQNECYE